MTAGGIIGRVARLKDNFVVLAIAKGVEITVQKVLSCPYCPKAPWILHDSMNRYPLWRYILLGVLIILGILYALPNLYGEDYAVQVQPKGGAVDLCVTE